MDLAGVEQWPSSVLAAIDLALAVKCRADELSAPLVRRDGKALEADAMAIIYLTNPALGGTIPPS